MSRRPERLTCNVPLPPTEYNPPLDSDNPNNPNNDFQFKEPEIIQFHAAGFLPDPGMLRLAADAGD